MQKALKMLEHKKQTAKLKEKHEKDIAAYRAKGKPDARRELSGLKRARKKSKRRKMKRMEKMKKRRKRMRMKKMMMMNKLVLAQFFFPVYKALNPPYTTHSF